MTTTTGSMLSCAIDGAVATLVINRPPANTLTPELLAELAAVVRQVAQNDAVKVVVLTGTGRFFIAGADIRLLASISSSREGETIALQGQAGNDLHQRHGIGWIEKMKSEDLAGAFGCSPDC